MKTEINKSEILLYHLEQYYSNGKKKYSLIRVIITDSWKKEEYHAGKWQQFYGTTRHYPESYPGVFIDEKRALEMIRLIDLQEQEDNITKKTSLK
ncbi:hypothetical protein IWQ47_002140 [Aquimarina sp. EL_43]|uniref:hypothetical protein n=1 Tax=unclassified Aquimarina TaxID=2627091 RepID=UPI0018C995A8|nr:MULTISPECIES: hypothetical protein [unclassified Aquimarina]MBG6130664.1 hypothetical protein [Aquimarina sp. EL_35]MBG6151190.1 hypothetical protein [Aquimarina sp. EL_32]MBG6169066.1 hypothetical protein [Aquimarina sp. EL_43]